MIIRVKEPKPPDPLLVKTTAEVKKLEAETKKLLLETAEVISKVILNLAKAEGEEAGQQIGMLEAHAKILIQQGMGQAKEEQPSGIQSPPSIEARAMPAAFFNSSGDNVSVPRNSK